MTNNQRGWRNWLIADNKQSTVKILDDFAEEVKIAWKSDSSAPRAYPFATEHVFSETIANLQGKKSGQKKRGLPEPDPPAKSFAELFDETIVRAVYDDKYTDTYADALRVASTGEQGATKAFHKLMKSAETAFLISLGFEIPAPRVHFLHRGLLGIAEVVKLDQTNKGLEEFFEDLCPCGKKHQAEAIRKLRKRKLVKSRS